ncbi:MAG: aminomethyl-transferring glycine dehydrogenase subunit GcvPB [Candidatus Zixiibacteriota bacterium]
MSEKLIFELSSPGRKGFSLPSLDVPKKAVRELVPEDWLRKDDPPLPEVSEVDVARHFVRLSIMNHHVDKGFYPLGSCTMKYNPKINETLSRLPGLVNLHPHQPEDTVQGALELMFELGKYLEEISGMDEISLQPAAGAHGELTSLLMINAYHRKNKSPRSKVIIPDSSHGTNPASVVTAGFSTLQIKSNEKGLVDIEELKRVMSEEVAALMITNPNTLGLFESDILQISRVVHDAGALLYMDGANLNALMGITRPGDMGFDVVHFNLHKTFSTPHGGGGPGSGPVGVKAGLAPFLPVPVIEKRTDSKGVEQFHLDYKRPLSIGRMHSFYGNFGVMVRAYVYIRQNGARGLREVSENAIINANYLKESLKQYYHLPYDDFCQHEFVLSGVKQKEKGVKTLDIAKRLLEFGLHAPTVYFPLIVPEALMIEPTETESKESLDGFIAAMIQIAKEAEENPQVVTSAPHDTPVGRLDEAKAAKDLNLRWKG